MFLYGHIRLNKLILASSFLAQMGGFNSPLTSRMTTVLGDQFSTIVFGMDVSHGSPGDVNVPSIAAVVATKNWPDVFHYSTQVRTQPAETQMIECLFEPGGGMVKYVFQTQFSFSSWCDDILVVSVIGLMSLALEVLRMTLPF